jgi:DNA-binding MarR family transcriptional regulator
MEHTFADQPTEPLALSTLLSHALVAFIIEFDNEFEHQMPHRTTNHGTTPGASRAPWLVSMVMWTRFLQFVPSSGITIGRLQPLVGLSHKGMQVWLTRLSQWWGYLRVVPDPADPRPNVPRAEWLVHPTTAGAQAQEIWRPLGGIVERRWADRFGKDTVSSIRDSLGSMFQRLHSGLPDSLPILGYGLFTAGPEPEWQQPGGPDEVSTTQLPLSALFSRVLYALASEYERESSVSMAISANLLRVLDVNGVPARELPQRTGVSKEAVAMALGVLEERQFAVSEADSAGGRFKVARLTVAGQQAQTLYHSRLAGVEARWRAQLGSDVVQSVRADLEPIVEPRPGEPSPLLQGLEPYPDGWRRAVPRPTTLPHYPMMLHRGGFPDGS